MPATIYGLSLTERLGPNSVGRKVLLHVTQLTLTPGHPYFLPSGCGSRHSHLPPRGLQIHVTSVRGNDVPASPPTPTPTATACRGASLPRCMETLRSQYGGKMGDKPGACIIAPTGRGLDWAPVLQCSSAAASCHLLCSSVHLLLATTCSSSLLLSRAYKGPSVLLN